MKSDKSKVVPHHFFVWLSIAQHGRTDEFPTNPHVRTKHNHRHLRTVIADRVVLQAKAEPAHQARVGTSANALHLQVWTRSIAILRHLKLLSNFGWALSNLLVMLRFNLFAYRKLVELARRAPSIHAKPSTQPTLAQLGQHLEGISLSSSKCSDKRICARRNGSVILDRRLLRRFEDEQSDRPCGSIG